MKWKSLPFWLLAMTLFVLVLLRVGMAVRNSRPTLDTVPVSGKVTYQKNTLPWGTVLFYPVDEKANRLGTAAIRVDGTYEVDTLANAKGLMAGQYKVSIRSEETPPYKPSWQQKAAAKRIKLPTAARYADPETSGLTLTIHPGDSPKTYDIDLKD